MATKYSSMAEDDDDLEMADLNVPAAVEQETTAQQPLTPAAQATPPAPSKWPDRKSVLIMLVMVLCVLAISIALAFAGFNTYSVHVYDPVVKSPADEKQYRLIRLENDLLVLLISDPTTDFSAAALTVDAGYYDDPSDKNGIANFVEHMVQFGSKRYTTQDELSAYLAQNNGLYSSSTFEEHTDFYFRVAKDYFIVGLDMFADAIAYPLFTPGIIQRELQAYSTMFDEAITDDQRVRQLVKNAANPANPFHQLPYGTDRSLHWLFDDGTYLNDQISDFHRKYYHTQNMQVVLLSERSLDSMQQLAVSILKRMPVKPKGGVTFNPDEQRPKPFLTLGRRFDVHSFEDENRVMLYWPTNPDLADIHALPLQQYISALLRSQEEGSIMNKLRDLGWASDIRAYIDTNVFDFSLFCVSITLTEAGKGHQEEIVEYVYHYIYEIDDPYLPRRPYNEHKLLAEINWKYPEYVRPYILVEDLAPRLRYVADPNLILSPPSMMRFDSAAIKEVLSQLSPTNSLAIFLHDQYTNITYESVSPWLDTEYTERDFSATELATWLSHVNETDFYLPPPNPYIVFNMTMEEDVSFDDVDVTQTIPQLLLDQSSARTWLRVDTYLSMPKARILYHMMSPAVYANVKNFVSTLMILEIVEDLIIAELWPAFEAGYTVQFTMLPTGLQLDVYGWSARTTDVFLTVIEALEGFLQDPRSPEFFEVEKTDFANYLKKRELAPSNIQGLDMQMFLIVKESWPPAEQLEAMDALTWEDVQTVFDCIFSSAAYESLYYGNLPAAQVVDLGNEALSRLRAIGSSSDLCLDASTPTFFNSRLNYHVAKMNKEYAIYRLPNNNPHDYNSAVVQYYQLGSLDNQGQMCLKIYAAFIQQKYIQAIEFDRDLAFNVTSYTDNYGNIHGMTFTALTSTENPQTLADAIVDFLANTVRVRIANLQDIEFSNFVDTVLANYLLQPRTVMARSDIIWAEIRSRDYLWLRRSIMANAAGQLSPASLLALHDSLASRVLSVQVFGEPSEMTVDIPTGSILFPNYAAFEALHTFY